MIELCQFGVKSRESLFAGAQSVKLLANENFPGEAVEALREDGHDVTWVRTEFPGASDRDVLAHAEA